MPSDVGVVVVVVLIGARPLVFAFPLFSQTRANLPRLLQKTSHAQPQTVLYGREKGAQREPKSQGCMGRIKVGQRKEIWKSARIGVLLLQSAA